MESLWWDESTGRLLLVDTGPLADGHYFAVEDGVRAKYVHYWYLEGDLMRWDYVGEL